MRRPFWSAIRVGAIAIILGVWVFCYILLVAVLWGGARVLRLPKRGIVRAMLVAAGIMVIGMANTAVALSVPRATVPTGLAAMFLMFLLILWVFRATLGRAAFAWLMVFGANVLSVALFLLLIRPHVADAFVVPTNSMAPTIIGEHFTARCPICGGAMIVPYSPLYPYTSKEESAFCPHCLLTTKVPVASLPSAPSVPDHIVVSKFLTPQRWDIVAYHAKTEIYIKRLVGMRGVTIMVTLDGHIQINGTDIGSPPDLPNWRFPWPDKYLSYNSPVHPDKAIHLGPDDYFVVGDWAECSLDSRLTGPVQRADIVGVVSLRYWPASRFHIFR